MTRMTLPESQPPRGITTLLFGKECAGYDLQNR